MKFISLFLFLILINGQHRNVEGEYFNYFGSKLKINSDSTFLYTWNFDLGSSWSKGNWKMKNDTVYFKVIPIYDTLRIANQKDTLILSADQKPQLITDKNVPIIESLTSGGQNRKKMSAKLFFKENKLIEIKRNGELETEKQTTWNVEKYNTWFVKKEN